MEWGKCGKECVKPSLIKKHAIAVYSYVNRREVFLPEAAREFFKNICKKRISRKTKIKLQVFPSIIK